MDPVAYIFTTLVALLAIGLVVLRVREAMGHTDRPVHYVAQPELTEQSNRSVAPVPPRSQAQERPWERSVPNRPEWTQEELLHILSTGKLIGPDGIARDIPRRKIALVVGLRADEAGEMIRAARNESDPAAPTRRQIAMRQSGDERLVEVDW